MVYSTQIRTFSHSSHGGLLMEKMFVWVGLFIGSSAGSWLGAAMGPMWMVVLGSVGAGLGFYAGRRIVQEYLE